MSTTREDAAEAKSEDSKSTSVFGRRRHGRIPSLNVSVELARIQLRRGYRWIWTQDFWILFMIAVGIVFLFTVWIAFDLARDVGQALAAGDGSTTGIRIAWSVLWLFMLALLVWTGLGSESDLENDGHYLTIRPVVDVLTGRLLATATQFSLYVLVPAGAAGVGLAVGTGSASPVIGMLAAGVVVTVSTTAIGYPIGLALKGFIRRSKSLSRYKSVLGLAVGMTYVVAVFTGWWVPVVEAIEPALLSGPFAWLGDLALVTTGAGDANVLGAVAAIAATSLITVGGLFLSAPIAQYAWTADRQHHEETGDEHETDAPDSRIDAVLTTVCRTQETLGIASTTLHRAYRAPHQLVFVAFPLLAVVPLAEELLTAGTLPWYGPWFVVWYGAWAAGAVIPLNPLGNQGATLPALVSSPADGRHVVHGHLLAATLPVAPLIAVLAVGAGSLADYPPLELAALALAGIAAVVVGSILAAGIGSVFPRFTAIDFSSSHKAVPPSKVAYGVFSVTLTLTVIATALVVDDLALEVTTFVLSTWLPFGLEVRSETLTWFSWAVLVGVAGSIPFAYRVAIRRIDGYRLS